VRVEIGPVSGPSAVAWVAYADEVLAALTSPDDAGRTPAAQLPADALERFARLTDEWRAVASPSAPFHWTSDESAEQVGFLMRTLYEVGLAVEREHGAGRMRLRPPEADEFHVVVVRQILAEIERESAADAHLVESLREEWGIAGRD